jgi:hypothetical protein
MKHLKTYENLNTLPKIGDYVVCKDLSNPTKILGDFININIGKITSKKSEDEFYIQYENVPPEIQEYFKYSNIKNTRYFLDNEILFWSKNKTDCEVYISSNKYNI